MRETNERLMEEQEKFYKIQLQDEVLLQERIDTLVGNVANIALQTDINRIHETALDVKRIWKSMVDCREMGLLLNERQKLFDMKVVPFDHLHKLMRDFEPYRSLWVTASGKYAITNHSDRLPFDDHSTTMHNRVGKESKKV